MGKYILNPNITMEFIEKFPNKSWNWRVNVYESCSYYEIYRKIS